MQLKSLRSHQPDVLTDSCVDHFCQPVILIGLFFLAIFNLLMGVSKSFAWMLCTRVASGMLSGCSSAMRAVLGEISTKETDPYFYPLFATTVGTPPLHSS